MSNPQVELHIAKLGVITLELDEAKAPKTVANFLSYVAKGHYNNTIFHRVIPGFMVQGGGMEPGETIEQALRRHGGVQLRRCRKRDRVLPSPTPVLNAVSRAAVAGSSNRGDNRTLHAARAKFSRWGHHPCP